MNDDPTRVNTPAAGMVERQELIDELDKVQNQLADFIWVNVKLQDEYDRLKAENKWLKEQLERSFNA